MSGVLQQQRSSLKIWFTTAYFAEPVVDGFARASPAFTSIEEQNEKICHPKMTNRGA